MSRGRVVSSRLGDFGALLVMCALAGCATARPAMAPADDFEAAPLDLTELTADRRTEFEAARVSVVDSDTSPTSYAFRNRGGDVAPDAFAQDYRRLTGRKDLDAARHASPGTPLVVLGSIGTAAGLAGSLALATSWASARAKVTSWSSST